MKIALVCDWLTNVGGAERVLLSLHELFPDAPIYTSQYNKKGITWFKNADVRTGWLQIFPSRLRRLLGPLRQLYFSHLDLSEYDLIISVTGAEAKAIKKGTSVHLCYCHVPTQYYWHMYDEYIKNPGFGPLNPLVRLAVKILVKPLRREDYKSAQRPTHFITISTHACNLIKKCYNRESTIIHPPVAVENFSTGSSKSPESEPYFIATSRQVTWKRLDLAIKACLKTKQKLLIIGEGPEHNNLVKLAKNSPLVTFLPHMSATELKPYLSHAKGYIFPSIEPFGIAPVEALAAGTPVIALDQGGSKDFIKDGKNGIFFTQQTVSSLAAAIEKFNTQKFDKKTVQNSAKSFSDTRFKQEIQDEIKKYF